MTTLQNPNQATPANSGAKPENSKTRVEIYTDGACHGNPGPGGWGFVALLMDESRTIIAKEERFGPAQGITTNNRAEMEAALNALAFLAEQQASGKWPTCPATLITDSEILVKGATQWMSGWIAKGWRKSNGKPVENRDLWERVNTATDGMAVEWRWVRGHCGNRWNERADELATKGAEEAARRGVTFREPAR